MNNNTINNIKIKNWISEVLSKEIKFSNIEKNKPENSLKVAVLSPMSYSFSMIALGHLSIYHRINEDKKIPAKVDRICIYEPLLGKDGMNLQYNIEIDSPLTTMENIYPLNELDIICVSLTTMDSITTVLQLLELGNISLKKTDRKKLKQPIIIAGGPGCINPEPLSYFFDIFCIGDGREATASIIKSIHKLKEKNQELNYSNIYNNLDNTSGIYIPSLKQTIDKKITLAKDPFHISASTSLIIDKKTAVIVPNYGCKHTCAYCIIGSYNYSESNTKSLLEYVKKYLDNGIDTLIINSASIPQHSQSLNLIKNIADIIEEHKKPIKVYIGSMRFDEISRPLLQELERLNAFSHTYLRYTNGENGRYIALAPEHGSKRLMKLLNRSIDPWKILNTIELVKDFNIHSFVLYFMVGFEKETYEDRYQIGKLILNILDLIHPYNGKIIAKINPIIPTPSTPYQRMTMPNIDTYIQYVEEIKTIILNEIGKERMESQLEIVLLPKKRLLVEAIINRGDNQLGDIILKIYEKRKNGQEPTDKELENWLKEKGLNFEELANKRNLNTKLPWQNVDQTDIKKEYKIYQELIGKDL